MKVEFKPGAIFDFLTKGELDDSLNPMRKVLDRIATREKPTDQDLQQSGVSTAGGAITLNFGAPPADQVWDVRRIGLASQDPTTITACVIRVHKREASALTLVAFGTSVPFAQLWSRHQATFKPGENLLVSVTGYTGAAFLGGLVQVEQTQWQALERYSI